MKIFFVKWYKENNCCYVPLLNAYMIYVCKYAIPPSTLLKVQNQWTTLWSNWAWPWSRQSCIYQIQNHVSINALYSLELGYIGYILLYALTLYNIDEEKFLRWELPEKDIRIIRLVGLTFIINEKQLSFNVIFC